MTAIHVADCDCVALGVKIEKYKTTQDACLAVIDHWVKRSQETSAGPVHRYWYVHGPLGHVVGIKDSAIGDLPPPILEYSDAQKTPDTEA